MMEKRITISEINDRPPNNFRELSTFPTVNDRPPNNFRELSTFPTVNDRPPNNFRELSTFPTIDEIHSKEKPYLRPIIKKGCYHDNEHYLDIQYRLLKEDLVSPLRDGIREIVGGGIERTTVKVYYDVVLLHAMCTNHGVGCKIMFDVTNTDGIPWEQSKRLIYGSLLCLSNDYYHTMLFATVIDRKPDELHNGVLTVRFTDLTAAKEYYRRHGPMLMVECPAYFEAYRHVLDGMKEIRNVPFPQYIIYPTNHNSPNHPRYLKDHVGEVTYDLSNISLSQQHKTVMNFTSGVKNISRTKILKKNQWPSYTDTTLNQSQWKAYMYAITNEFCVIQGPPGTGKTHVGLRIADTLLKNKKFWTNENRGPMLIVSYTNHALDQFLKGLIEFGYQNVIRVGGRASEELCSYNLRMRSHSFSDKEHRYYKHRFHVYKEELAGTVTSHIKVLETLNRNVTTGKLLDYKSLMYDMRPEHYKHLNALERKCNELCISVFEVFLGLIQITPQNIRDMYMVERSFNEGDSVVVTHGSFMDASTKSGRDGNSVGNTGGVPLGSVDGNNNKINRDSSKARNEIKDNAPITLVDKNGFITVLPSIGVRKHRAKEYLTTSVKMSEEEASRCVDPWQLDVGQRWRLYMYWIDKFRKRVEEDIEEEIVRYENVCKMLNEMYEEEDEVAMKKADVIAMTTTCASRYRQILGNIKPKIVIIEEAAEVLEAHVVMSLSDGLEHLILIGDHKQLKPSPAVYELATKYSLDVSLFERMVNNGMQCHMLDTQHRMRPEIARLVRHIYPNLRNHVSVLRYPNVIGIQKNVLFINHSHPEMCAELSKSNIHEANFIKYLCRYLIQQGYNTDQITILTGYTGQVLTFKNIMRLPELEGVRITAVDNFQGEENDIILLSLVRSNSEGKIGFLKTENRICVSLSRAKIGLYVIGNFNLLERESPVWKKIINDMRASDSINDYLPLRCVNHPDTVVRIVYGEDFAYAPDGGCMQPCEYILACGHVCQMACHPYDQLHEQYICKQKCDRETLCTCDHRCPRACHYGEECGLCQVIVLKSISLCGHTQSMRCCDDPEEFVCREKCSRILKCGHDCSGNCWEICKIIPCMELVTMGTEGCGHTRRLLCNEAIKDVKYDRCSVMIQNVIPSCGHTQDMKCSDDPEKFFCKEKCPRLRKCGHGCMGHCGKKCEQVPCNVLVPKEMEFCEHTRLIRCCEDTKDVRYGPCTVIVKKTIPSCGHIQRMKCCDDPDEYICRETCSKILKCGHTCMRDCGEKCEQTPCNELIIKDIGSCGHPQQVLCSQNMNEITCKSTCNSVLDCKHICTGTCEKCKQGRLHVKCVRACNRFLVCSHPCTAPCTTDCPPCTRRCENSCVHIKCEKFCWEVCIPCTEPCTWRCEHLICERRCYEICDRGRCNVPCEKKLKCGHTCVGMCGEICPSLCRICHRERITEIFGDHQEQVTEIFVGNEGENRERETEIFGEHRQRVTDIFVGNEDEHRERVTEIFVGNESEHRGQVTEIFVGNEDEHREQVTEIFVGNEGEYRERVTKIFVGNENENEKEDTARFIVLTDCKHTFEVSAFDKWMEMDPENQDAIIKLKECPKCSTPIRRSLRYGNIVKTLLLDIDQIKQKLIDGSTMINRFKTQGYHEYKQMRIQFGERKYENRNDFPSEERLRHSHKLSRYSYSTEPSVRLVANLYSASSLSEVTRYLQVAKILRNAYVLKLIAKRFVYGTEWVEWTELLTAVDELVLYASGKLSKQQYRQVMCEFRRLHLFLNICELKHHLDEVMILSMEGKEKEEESHKDYSSVEQLLDLFRNRRIISLEDMKIIMAHIQVVRKRQHTNALTSFVESKVNRMHVYGNGHWFKCNNGHCYTVEEHVVSRGMCPECRPHIDIVNHDLRDIEEQLWKTIIQ